MKLLYCLFVIYLITGCSSKSLTQSSGYSESEGCVISTISKYTNEGIPAFSSPVKVWYRENEIIQEVTTVHFDTDTNGVQTIRDILDYYAYVNYDARKFSLYHTFSDTANSFKNYIIDSLYKIGISDFFTLSKKTLDSVTAIELMPDTLIEDILYQRKKYTQQWKNRNNISIVYFRCDRPNSRFSIFKNELDSCSPVKKINYNSNGTGFRGSTAREFIIDSLTTEEKKVFQAWRKQMTKQAE